MLSVRVPTSSSSFLRSTSTRRPFCFNDSTPAAVAASCDSRSARSRAAPDLSLDLSDLLLSILKNEQLFQFRMHGRLTY